MGESYSSNISFGGLVFGVNPSTYDKTPMRMGNLSRTVVGTLVVQDVSSEKFSFTISSLTQSQIEQIKNYVALDYNIELIDYIPISERDEASRTVYELVETVSIGGQTIVRYIPTYTVAVVSFDQTYEGNTVKYTIVCEEM